MPNNNVAKILTSNELLKYVLNMDMNNSVFQFLLPGKGKFTLVMQEEDKQAIEADVLYNKGLEQMFIVSEEEYHRGLGITTQELLSTLSEKDFL
jgi:hypothetical protein